MNKSIALIALLLPFSGYGQTKKERMREIEKMSYELNYEALQEWIGFLFKMPCVQLSLSMIPEEEVQQFKKLQKELHDKMIALTKEYNQLG